MIDPVNPDYSNTPASAARNYGRYSASDQTAEPVVTILTAFYNTDSVFDETAETVFKQTFQQWEWVIVNDCSGNAEALKVLDKYRQLDDPRIRVIDLPENGGPSRARNYGVSKARTEYIYHLDSDDLIEPTTLEKCFWYLVSHPECPWVNGWSVGFGAEEYLWRFGYGDEARFLEENLVTGRTMIRKHVFEAIGGYDPEIKDGAEDWGFWLKGAEMGYWGATIPEFFDWYRRREQHWSRWETIDDSQRMEALRQAYASQFPQIFSGQFPQYSPRPQLALEGFKDELPAENRLNSSKPRLLMILPWMAMGGADKFNLDLMDQMVANGWSVSLATTRNHDNPWQHEFEKRTPEVYILNNFVHLSQHALFLRYLIESKQPDAVLISGSEFAYWQLPYLKHHFPNIPFLDYCHIEELYWKNGGYPRYAAMSQSLLELNLVSSEYLRQWMVDQCAADPEHIRVITTNIDADEWVPDEDARKSMREKLSIEDSMPLILFAGRFCPQKQPEVLMQALKKLRQNGCEFRAVLLGDGESRGWMEQFIKNQQLEDYVELPGAVSLRQTRVYMQAADVFFLPSLWEGIALSLYESMAVGLPVVASSVGGQEELVTPATGVLVQRDSLDRAGEIEAYYNAIERLLRDPEERRRLGGAARQRIVKEFPLSAVSSRFLDAVDFAKTMVCQGDPYAQGSSARYAHEQAIRATEYFRMEHLAEHLWGEVHNKGRSNATAIAAFSRDPLRDWDHIHKYVPFRIQRWCHTQLLPAIGLKALSSGCYDEGKEMVDRLKLLQETWCYRFVFSLKRISFLSRHLPRSPSI